MVIERTLSIIKPNAVAKNVIGNIYTRFENHGFKIIGIKMLQLTKKDAIFFYIEHKNKLFFNKLIEFISFGPIVVFVLEGKNVIQCSRDIIGATNPTLAKIGTIRADYSDSITKNAIHGSDSIKSASREISFFFKKNELFSNYE